MELERDYMIEFLYHSNKMEGSNITREVIRKLINGVDILEFKDKYRLDDLLETVGSINAYSFIVYTREEPITKRLLFELHSLLKKGTRDELLGYTGHYKIFDNKIASAGGIEISTTPSYLVEEEINTIIKEWDNSDKELEDIAKFHFKFETIHPFNDGNGRIGRFIMLKQFIENNCGYLIVDSNNNYKELLSDIQKNKRDIKELTELLERSII